MSYTYRAAGRVLASDRALPFEPAREGGAVALRLVWDSPRAPWVSHVGAAPAVLVHAVQDDTEGPHLSVFWSAPQRSLSVRYGAWHARLCDGELRCARFDEAELAQGPADDAHGHALAALLERIVFPLAELLLRDDRLVLHGNALALGGRAWVFVGPSGAGKSTTTLFLLARGARLLGDDRVPCDPRARLVAPGPSAVRLAAHAPLPPGLLVRDDEAARAAPTGPDGKRTLRFAGSCLAQEVVPLAGVVLLTQEQEGSEWEGAPRLEPVGAQALGVELLHQSFALTDPPQALRVAQFRLLMELSRSARALRWRYRAEADPAARAGQLAALWSALAALPST